LTSIRRIVVLLGVAGFAACDPPPATSLAVGVHDVELRVPEGWQHYDHGQEHRFENGFNQISLEDLGPATPEAYQREVALARALFERGQLADAREQLGGLAVRIAFPTEERWESFEEPWKLVSLAGHRGKPFNTEAVTLGYSEVLAQIGALPMCDLATTVTGILDRLDTTGMREIAEQEPLAIGGRDALRVDTWDRLSHDWRQRYVFVLNNGNLLVARMELGKFPEMEPAFQALLTSLRFSEPLGVAQELLRPRTNTIAHRPSVLRVDEEQSL